MFQRMYEDPCYDQIRQAVLADKHIKSHNQIWNCDGLVWYDDGFRSDINDGEYLVFEGLKYCPFCGELLWKPLK